MPVASEGWAMNAILLGLLTAFCAAVVATPLCRWLGLKWGVVDQPDQFRKVHRRPIPRTGGIAVYAGLLVGVAVLWLSGSHVTLHRELAGSESKLPALLLGALLTLILGATDDVRGMRPRHKLLGQAAIGLAMCVSGVSISGIGNPFGTEPIMFGWLSYPVTILWFMGCMNAVNLIDGLDGLAAGVGLFAAVAIAACGVILDHPLATVVGACLAGAILGFLIFNFNPASIFLGDGGSLLIGFMLAALAIVGSVKAGAVVTLVVPFVALGLPIFDTALAIVRRWSRGLPLAAADRQHLHHTLVALGLTHRTAVLILYTFSLLLAACALLVSLGRTTTAALVLTAVCIVAIAYVRFVGALDLRAVQRRLTDTYVINRRTKLACAEMERVLARVREATSATAAWEAAKAACMVLELDSAELTLGTGPTRETMTWERDETVRQLPPTEDRWDLRLSLIERGRLSGSLVFTRFGGDLPVPTSCELLGRLRAELQSRLAALHRPLPEHVAARHEHAGTAAAAPAGLPHV